MVGSGAVIGVAPRGFDLRRQMFRRGSGGKAHGTAMNKYLALVPLAMLAASPAHATGGLVCRTASARPIIVSMGFGHVPGSPLILTRLTDAGRNVPVSAAQWWLDNREVRLILIGANAMRRELLLRASRNGHTYDGSVWRGGRRHWVRCRED